MNTPLTPAQRTELATALQARQAQLDRQLAEHQGGGSHVQMARELLQEDAHDQRERDADREVELARSDREMAELGRVSQALQRVQSPEFGFCQDCGDAIPFARLSLEPWALRCVGCESKAEGHQARHTM